MKNNKPSNCSKIFCEIVLLHIFMSTLRDKNKQLWTCGGSVVVNLAAGLEHPRLFLSPTKFWICCVRDDKPSLALFFSFRIWKTWTAVVWIKSRQKCSVQPAHLIKGHKWTRRMTLEAKTVFSLKTRYCPDKCHMLFFLHLWPQAHKTTVNCCTTQNQFKTNVIFVQRIGVLLFSPPAQIGWVHPEFLCHQLAFNVP